MRPGLVLILLAACSPAPPAGPAWPKLSPRPVDGGESLAPREGARAFAAVEQDRPDRAATDTPAAATTATPPGTDAAAKPAAPSPAATDPTSTPFEEPMMTEEIVIEVDD